MNKEFASFISALRLALKANRLAGEALAKFRPTYNRLAPEAQYQVRLQVGGIIAKAFECEAHEATYRGEKTIGFDGERKNDARNAMRYYFPTKSDSRGSSNKVDPVKALLNKYNALTGAEKRRFLASI